MRRVLKRFAAVAALAGALGALPLAAVAAPKPKPAPAAPGPATPTPNPGKKPLVPPTANYEATVAGVYSGTGTADSKGGTVSISVNVTDDAGNKGTLTVSGLQVDDKLHFSGTGSAFGKSIKITGRLDPVPTNDPQLKTQRLVATFVTADNNHGRIIGHVPVIPGSSTSGGGGGGSGGGGGGNQGGNNQGGGGGKSDDGPENRAK